MKSLLVLDGTVQGAERRATGLGRFFGEGVSGAPAATTGETVVLYEDAAARDDLVALAPTPGVRLVRVPARRPDVVAAVLAELAGGGKADLVLFDSGPSGSEAAARCAVRTRGTLCTAALDLDCDEAGPVARRSVYSGHMIGRFRLSARPWCVTVDPGWQDGAPCAATRHAILSDVAAAGAVGDAPFADADLTTAQEADDLADARIVVVAGNGAGSREGVARIAAAAARMGAAFGVSRPVAMNAWASVDRLIGVSGKRVAPAVCIVAGASGAPALLWGVERAGVIVAVNPDEHAPIARAADAVVRGDAVTVVEALADAVADATDAV
jgi:electron transfer flavoprotein alpha subunit